MTLPATGQLNEANKQEGGRRQLVIAALGITQIIAWGASYYLPAVLADPISVSTGWTLPQIIGGLSIGLLLAGLISVRTGHAIYEKGGRPVLITSTLVHVIGLLVLASAETLLVYYLAWVILGFAMGTGLYDAVFSTLGRLYGATARTAITILTLWAGFTSTVAWPFAAYMVEQFGWRQTCLAFAALLLFVSLPLIYFVVPAEEQRESLRRRPSKLPSAANDDQAAKTQAVAPVDRYFLLLAAALTTASVVNSIWFIHILTLLQATGTTLAVAVGLAALLGPTQFVARVAEMLFGQRFHPLWTMITGLSLMTLSFALLGGIALPALAVVCFGIGQGVFSIARGTVPLALYGAQQYPVILGRLAMPGLFAQAVAPSIGAIAIEFWGAYNVIYMMVGVTAFAVVAASALKIALRHRTPLTQGS